MPSEQPAPNEPRLIDAALLDTVSAAAQSHPRRRKNHNFHAHDQHPGHRLLNAIEPDSYVPPHRHLDPQKDETLLALRGRLAVLIFDGTGAITRVIQLAPATDTLGVDIPSGVWHSVFARDPGSIFFEAKAGPFVPLAPNERAPWAPAENTADAAAYLAKMRAAAA